MPHWQKPPIRTKLLNHTPRIKEKLYVMLQGIQQPRIQTIEKFYYNSNKTMELPTKRGRIFICRGDLILGTHPTGLSQNVTSLQYVVSRLVRSLKTTELPQRNASFFIGKTAKTPNKSSEMLDLFSIGSGQACKVPQQAH